MLEILETIKKHGALGMTVIALIWMNSRLNSVEDKLYNCLSENQEIRQASTHSKVEIKEKLIAILPNDRKNKKFIS
jgi:hypothetical protein